MSRAWPFSLCCLVLLLTVVSAVNNVCDEVKTCLSNGQEPCDRTSQNCPPCIYSLQNQYTCWDKDNSTNSCPFTGVKYDCSVLPAPSDAPVDVAVSPVPTETPAPVASENSQVTTSTFSPAPAVNTESGEGSSGGANHMVIIAVAGVGVVLVFAAFVAIRRHRSSKNNDNHEYSVQNRKKEELSPAVPYRHMIEKTYRKRPEPEARGRGSEMSEITRSTGYSVASDARSGFTPSRDVSMGCSTSVNVLEEYLKAKQEIDYDIDVMSDVMSDLSDIRSTNMSLPSPMDRQNRGISVTDSEFDQDRSRGYSECDSEMSYDDERYSFSNEEPQNGRRERDREVEI